MTSYLAQQYLFAGIVIVLTVALAGVMVLLPQILGRLLGLQRPTPQKLEPYECGIKPVGGARVRFSIKFYVVTMLFILFDIEAVFFYPWSLVHRWLGWFGLIEMGLFAGILLLGLVYVWKRGGLQWES